MSVGAFSERVTKSKCVELPSESMALLFREFFYSEVALSFLHDSADICVAFSFRVKSLSGYMYITQYGLAEHAQTPADLACVA